jgi:hypothetical protein
MNENESERAITLHPVSDVTLESALADTEAAAEQALKLATATVMQLRKARAAAAVGQLRDLRKALDAAATSSAEAAATTDRLRTGYDFDEDAHLNSGAFVDELLAAARAASVSIVEEDERLLAYPSLLRLLPGDLALEIDKKRERRLRPSFLVRLLGAAQQRTPKFQVQRFVESLAAAYEVEIKQRQLTDGDVVRLADLYRLLTMLPGARSDYSLPEFARDLYLTDQQGQAVTKSGRPLRWHASTGTKGAGALTTVGRTGQQQRYWGISFGEPGA